MGKSCPLTFHLIESVAQKLLDISYGPVLSRRGDPAIPEWVVLRKEKRKELQFDSRTNFIPENQDQLALLFCESLSVASVFSCILKFMFPGERLDKRNCFPMFCSELSLKNKAAIAPEQINLATDTLKYIDDILKNSEYICCRYIRMIWFLLLITFKNSPRIDALTNLSVGTVSPLGFSKAIVPTPWNSILFY